MSRTSRQDEARGLWLGLLGVVAFAMTLPMTRLAGGTVIGFPLFLGLAVLSASIGYVAGARLSAQMKAERVICRVLVFSLPLTLPLMLATWPEHPVRPSAWGGFAYVTLFSLAVVATVLVGKSMPAHAVERRPA